MNILFTICGRAGSKGMANKNLKKFNDYPLAFYSLAVIDMFFKQTNNNGHIVLSTDSVDLIELFNNYQKIPVNIIERNEQLSSDHAPKIEVIRDAYKQMKYKNNIEYDMVVDLDITSPLRTYNDVFNLIEKKNKSTAEIVFSVTSSRRNPYFNMVSKKNDGYERVITSDFNTRQEAPEIYDMNASLYAYAPSFLENDKSFFDAKLDIITMMDTGILDIDDEHDYELMQVIGTYLFKTNNDFKVIRDHIKSILK